ncbi:MAG: protein arginine kinase [Verrucomicrobiae bacterium]|nr:protein arginine kinase [Verrucomicrobiae bacterium]
MKPPKSAKSHSPLDNNDAVCRRIVMSSRVRLARNLRNTPFPGWAKKADRIKILESIQPVVAGLPEMKDCRVHAAMDQFTAVEKQVLVEKHLISREHAAKNIGSGVVINRAETLSLMINEEDHLRMQAIMPGLQLGHALEMIDHVDSELEARLDFAFDPRLGFLTACPTNVGTGMRASAMLHLPALVLAEQINQIIQAVNKLGLAVRGLYGEGTEATGNLFQISNQTTLGEQEAEIIERLAKVIAQIIEHEENARAVLLEKKSVTINDQVGRAYGIMQNAHSMNSKETLNLLSLMRLGIDLHMFEEALRGDVDELFIASQPAHLQKSISRKLSAEERDILRADLIREKLTHVSKPKPKKTKPPETHEESA